MNVLAVSCHPDDIEIGCGGTLARYVKEGHNVTICHCANGNMGHVLIQPDELGKIRIEESIRGGEKMGVTDVAFQTEVPPNDAADLAVPCFQMSKVLRKAPAMIAEDIASRIQPAGAIASVVAVNGYLNFKMDESKLVEGTVKAILESDGSYGAWPKKGVKVNVEHTSTNPTGPIHVGRARNPVIGDTLARALSMYGYDVTTE